MKTFAWCSPSGIDLMTGGHEIAREALSRWKDFPKPLEKYKILEVLGTNIVTTEGHEWKAHRKVVGPQFSEANNQLIQKETVRVGNSMFEHWESLDPSKFSVEVDVIDSMRTLALKIISSVMYGLQTDWNETIDRNRLPGKHTLSMEESIEIVAMEGLLYFPEIHL
ncbi:hypothetical protein HDU76_010806 [Blyttiomyces sp. JEL0837]|nr:hypothetical protein HDU76_010806 [Blyttiomyces sp. JEL0837]